MKFSVPTLQNKTHLCVGHQSREEAELGREEKFEPHQQRRHDGVGDHLYHVVDDSGVRDAETEQIRRLFSFSR